MKYVLKEELKTILVAALGHTKSDIHFQSQSEINFRMAERCHYQRTLRYSQSRVFVARGSKMAEWRKFAAKQKAKRRGKNQVVEESKVAEEIVVQRMSGDVSGKQQKYSRIGAQEYVPFEQDELSIHNIKEAGQKYFGPQIEKDLVCDVLAGERGPSCNKMAQIPNKKVFYVRFVKVPMK